MNNKNKIFFKQLIISIMRLNNYQKKNMKMNQKKKISPQKIVK